MTDDEKTIMDDAQDQLSFYHRATPEEKRALEVLLCAEHAVIDAARLCVAAGLTGTAVQTNLTLALEALSYADQAIRD